MARQDRGFTPTLEKLCEALDSELQRLLDDLRLYLYKERKGASQDKILFGYDEDDDSEQIYSDKGDIELYLREVSDRNIQRFVITFIIISHVLLIY